MQIAVVGGGLCSPEACETARQLGLLLASRGHILLSSITNFLKDGSEKTAAGQPGPHPPLRRTGRGDGGSLPGSP